MSAKAILANKEICEASDALIRWFQSQDIPPASAVAVMAKSMAGIVCMTADEPGSVKKTVNRILELIVVQLEEDFETKNELR